jgi:hypothetical protein
MEGLSPACRQCEEEKRAAVAAATGVNENEAISAGIRSLSGSAGAGSAGAGASGVSPISRLKEARSRSSSASEPVATGHNPFAKSAAVRRVSMPNGSDGSGAAGSGGTKGGRGKKSRKHRSRKHRSRKHSK